MSKKKLLLSLLVVAACFQAKAQTAFSVSSHSATIQGNTYEYVIGEMTLVSTERNSNLIVTQGYLQPVESNRPAQVDLSDASALVKVYPNPTQDIVNVEGLNTSSVLLNYTLFDVTGKVLQEQVLDKSNHFSVDLKPYAGGNYYLLINATQGNEPVKYSYKIQKKN